MEYRLRRRPEAACAPILIALVSPLPALAEEVGVLDELERLSAAHGFSVKGIEQVEEALGRAEGDDLFRRLRRLLKAFDHVIVQDAEGGVEKVIILGAKTPVEAPPPPVSEPEGGETAATPDGEGEVSEGDIVLETIRQGTQHAVTLALEGQGDARIEQTLLIDTGSDSLVLPASMAEQLGISQSDLSQREMQTANGKVDARVGKVQALWLGETRVTDIDVAFVEDAKLGGGLLGMSVLGRYRMTIDDESNKLTLSPK
jgi:clan AA aspartic protease (TIGR02281 family)